MSVAVLIPVLDRPDRVAPLVASLRASTRFIEATAYFVLSPGDTEEEAAANQAFLEAGEDTSEFMLDVDLFEVPWEPGQGDYAKKINRAADYASASHEWLLLGADDLVFHPGWIERALATYLETGACVIGTNDLGNGLTMAGKHATHPLVHRDYLDCGLIDDPDSRKLLFEGYDHNFCDNEFVATAIARETWAHATDSIVEHAHPIWGKAAPDDTYVKGQLRYPMDRELFEQRKALWS